MVLEKKSNILVTDAIVIMHYITVTLICLFYNGKWSVTGVKLIIKKEN